MNKKGMIFSMDALAALLLVTIISFGVITSINLARVDYGSVLLQLNAVDGLSVVREEGSLEGFNNNSLQGFLNDLPVQVCGNLSVYDFEDKIVYDAVKNGCNSVGVGNMGVARRDFLSGNNVYMAKLEVWRG